MRVCVITGAEHIQICKPTGDVLLTVKGPASSWLCPGLPTPAVHGIM